MKRIKISLHPAGAIALLIAFLLMDSHCILSAVLSLVIHESAHLLAMCLCGIRDCAIELTPFGGMVDARDFDIHPPWKRAISASAGIISSAVSAWVCWNWASRTVFWLSFFQSNLSLCMLNGLPAWPLDGARVLSALASCVGYENGIKKLMRWLSWVIGIGFVAVGLYGTWYGLINPSLFFIGPYLCYAARTENISEKVRKIEYAGNKLDYQALVPVSIWAGTSERTSEHFGALLGRMQSGRYNLLLHIDKASGCIQKCWTEKEIINHLFANGNNCPKDSIDKVNCL